MTLNSIRPVCGMAAFLLAVRLAGPLLAQTTQSVPDPEAAYEKMIDERATKIIEPLNLEPDKAAAVKEIMLKHYRDLKAWSAEADPKLKALRDKLSEANKAKDTQAADKIKAEIAGVQGTRTPMHEQFVRDLVRVVPFTTVNRIKDGMTFNNVAIRTTLYKDLDLTEEQRTEIRDMLITTREQAMDAGTSNEKAAMFLETVGRISLRVLTPEQNAALKAAQHQSAKKAATTQK